MARSRFGYSWQQKYGGTLFAADMGSYRGGRKLPSWFRLLELRGVRLEAQDEAILSEYAESPLVTLQDFETFAARLLGSEDVKHKGTLFTWERAHLPYWQQEWWFENLTKGKMLGQHFPKYHLMHDWLWQKAEMLRNQFKDYEVRGIEARVSSRLEVEQGGLNLGLLIYTGGSPASPFSAIMVEIGQAYHKILAEDPCLQQCMVFPTIYHGYDTQDRWFREHYYLSVSVET